MASKAESSPPFFLDAIQILSNNTELLETCKEVFTNERYKQLIQFRQCEINKLELPQNSAFLLPGNSFGFLSEQNELHSKAIELFGESLQHEITSSIQSRHHGELLVGESSLLSFPNPSYHILYTPTSRIDSCNTSKMSVFLSTRAALRRICTLNRTTDAVKINTLIVCEFPVLMPVYRIALQMKVAIDEILFDRCSSFKAPTQLPDPMSLEVALTRIKSSAEIKTYQFLKACTL